ncbi:MAG: hypothetical protein IJX53_05725 [Clostridia bacterium]|nr:hypothetical protein [Clostridia bacterium]
MKRTLTMVLAALMLCGTLAACSSGGDSTDTTAAPSAADTTVPAGETADPTKDADGFMLDSLPADLKFDGESIGILTWEDVEMPEFEVEEITGDIVNDAIYKRNETVANRLGVNFEWYETKGNASNGANYLKAAQNSFNAGEKIYDIYAAYSRTAGTVAINGLCYNLNQVQYLDFEKPWWPERMLNAFDINGDLYFISGDISTNVLHFMYGIYYNKDMITDYQLTDPTEYVLNGTWTLDKMIEMTTGIYQDLNNNASVDYDDRFGMTTLSFHMDAFYTGSGLRLVEIDETDTLKISDDFSSEKTVNLVDKLGPWAATDDFLYGVNDGTYEKSFVEDNALLCLNRMYLADRKLREVTFTYGIVPVPKYDESQEKHITVMGNPFTLYMIASDCEDPDMAAAVLEAMGSAGYRMTTPAIFETNMKVKYSADNVNAQMFDIIREGVDFDLGRIFGANLNLMSEMPSNVIWQNKSWATAVKPYTKVLGTQLGKIVDKLEAIE